MKNAPARIRTLALVTCYATSVRPLLRTFQPPTQTSAAGGHAPGPATAPAAARAAAEEVQK